MLGGILRATEDGRSVPENGIRDGRVDRAAGAGRSEPREGTTIMPATVRRPRAATETAV